jgi:hypothetical protein
VRVTDQGQVAAYEFDLPKGFEADEAQLGQFKGLAVKHGLRPQAAAEIVGLHAQAVTAARQADGEVEARTVAGWTEQAKALPEWKAADRSAAVAAVKALAPPAARQLLDGPLGSYPAVVSLVVTLGRELRRLRGGGSTLFANTPGMRP